jgi:hypothetical protein
MERLTIGTAFVALFAGLLALTPTNIFKICAWNAGTQAVDPWRVRASGAARLVSATLRAWFTSLGGWRLALCCLAVFVALLAAQLAVGHSATLFAVALPVATLKANRTALFTDASALKRADGTFENDEKRSAFDAKMTEVEALDAQIREAEAVERRQAAAGGQLTDEQRQAAVTEERARAKGITEAVRVAGLERADADDMIGRGITLDAARAEIFAKMAAKSNANPTRTAVAVGAGGGDEKQNFLRGSTNWLLTRAGVAPMVAKHEGVDLKEMAPGQYRGFSLVELARECLEMNGIKTRGLDKMTLVGRAFTEGFSFRDSGIQEMLARDGGIMSLGTTDFSTLLENALYKVLQAAYATVPDTWKRFCNQSSVVDFRTNPRYRMGNFSVLDGLNEHGEFKQKGINDAEKASIVVTTKGNIIAISRQAIVNDDVNFFSTVPARFGRAAALSVEADVYALLAQNSGLGPTMPYDSVVLFNAAHGNLTTGAALSAAAIDADRVAMASQKEPNSNDYIDARPAVLVIGVGLGGQARVINTSLYDPDNVASGSKATMKPNVVAGLFKDVVDSPRVTAISATRRYLFADPAVLPVLEVAFLDGQTAPVLETQNGWRVDGVEMKCRLDYGVAAVDHRGAITNAGV